MDQQEKDLIDSTTFWIGGSGGSAVDKGSYSTELKNAPVSTKADDTIMFNGQTSEGRTRCWVRFANDKVLSMYMFPCPLAANWRG